MKEISSRTSDSVKTIVSLHSPKGRQQHEQFIAQGLRVIQTLLAGGYQLVQLYATYEQLVVAHGLCPASKITKVSPPVMDKISSATNPSGLLAVFAIPAAPSPRTLNSGIVLAQVQDPGNVGALIRTAAAMKVHSVVLVESVDPFNPKVVQASAGTIAQVALFRMSWTELMNAKRDMRVCALVVQGGTPLESLKAHKSLLVVGNEAHGLPAEWIAKCDEQITLSMPGNVESLNAAIAGSIALYTAWHAKLL